MKTGLGKLRGIYEKSMGKLGKSWENYGKTMGNLWENGIDVPTFGDL